VSRIEKALEKASQLRQKSSAESLKTMLSQNESAAETAIDLFPAQDKALCVTNPLMIVATDPTSYISEEYQKLKGLLISLSRKGEFSNVLMITSSIPGEGKSITAINLALTFAKEIDTTVLLIDADLRKPSVASYLGISTQRGLTDILEGCAEIEETLFHTGIGKLVVLPAGKIASNPVELFSSNRMIQFVQEIKHRYPDRFIIIDTPPILPFAETRTLASLVDGVVLVIKEHVTTAANVAEAVSLLNGVQILGAVYNEANVTVGNDRYGHYYSGYRYSPSALKNNRDSLSETQ
jgi:protein-tyrosine kinase